MGGIALRFAVVAQIPLTGFVLRLGWKELAHPTRPALAQTDHYDCASFSSQESAYEMELARCETGPRTNGLQKGTG